MERDDAAMSHVRGASILAEMGQGNLNRGEISKGDK